ncbi:glycosyltransferase [Priestia sp. SIMBA_032]|uniref:glycosyltransferase n=1 Tax=Priestia sp. SIMBA_032 TaxID=3085775 RepID=UPI00397B60B8
MKKIIFVVPIMRGIGGIETSLLNILSNIDYSKYEVDLCVFANYIAFPEKIPSQVNIIKGNKLLEYCYIPYVDLKENLGLFEKLKMLFAKGIKKVFGFQTVIKMSLPTFRFGNYDMAISYANDAFFGKVFAGGGNEIVDKCILAEKKVGWIHNEPNRCGCSKEYFLKTYENFDHVVNVSFACKEMFDAMVPEFSDKSVVVYNMFHIEGIKKKAKSVTNPYNTNVFNIVTVSRIENNQKRVDRILDTCEYLLSKSFEEFKWTIIGDGPDSEYIIKEAESRGLKRCITFTGKMSNPYPYILNADVMVQASDYEAYSMVLQESIILNTPLIVTNYPSANEAVDNNYNGFLVDLSYAAIGDKLIEMIEDADKLKLLRGNITKKPFTNSKALSQFYSLL